MGKLELFIKICLRVAGLLYITAIVMVIFACILAKVYWAAGLMFIIMLLNMYVKKRG